MRYVYFIKPVGMQGPVKIGCSANPDARLITLDTWAPFRLEIVATIGGGLDLERRFHAAFIDTHDRREWFGWSRPLQSVIDQINGGTFDIATLPEPVLLKNNFDRRSQPRTPIQRLRTSLNMRITATRKKTGFWIKRGLNPMKVGGPGGERVQEEIEAYLADPATHGLTAEAYFARDTAEFAARQADITSHRDLTSARDAAA